MTRAKNKLAAFAMSFIMAFTFASFTEVAKGDQLNSVTVRVTVSDITDVNKPFNILEDRRELTITEFSLSSESEAVINPQLLENYEPEDEHAITYLHALIALHKAIYGNDLVSGNVKFYINEDGDTVKFFGKIVASILYKNGNDILGHPLDTTLSNGDELYICLYNFGYIQAVATFDESYVSVDYGDPVELQLLEYLEDPEDSFPIPYAYITDKDGVYLLNEYGEPLRTDKDGKFTVRFIEGGDHFISVMPDIQYFMDTSGEVEYITVPRVEVSLDLSSSGPWYPLDPSNIDYLDDPEIQAVVLYYLTDGDDSQREAVIEEHKNTPVFAFAWGDETVYYDTYPIAKSEDPEPMIRYTPTFANVHVDTELKITGADFLVSSVDGYSRIDLWTNNYQFYEEGKEPVAFVAKYERVEDPETHEVSKGKLIGFVGERYQKYRSSAGDTVVVDGNEVTITIKGVPVEGECTLLVKKKDAESLNDGNVAYINEYTGTGQDIVVRFNTPSQKGNYEYTIIINKDDGGQTITVPIYIYDKKAEVTDSDYMWKKVTSADTFWTFTTPEHEEDIIYKILVWEDPGIASFTPAGRVMEGVEMEGQCTTPEIAARLNANE